MTEQEQQRPDDLPPPETILLAAFEGWNDAGSAATQALEHVHESWDAVQVDELDPEEYHDFQVCLLYTSPSPRDRQKSRMPSSA